MGKKIWVTSQCNYETAYWWLCTLSRRKRVWRTSLVMQPRIMVMMACCTRVIGCAKTARTFGTPTLSSTFWNTLGVCREIRHKAYNYVSIMKINIWEYTARLQTLHSGKPIFLSVYLFSYIYSVSGKKCHCIFYHNSHISR